MWKAIERKHLASRQAAATTAMAFLLTGSGGGGGPPFSVSVALFPLLQFHFNHAEISILHPAHNGSIGDEIVRTTQIARLQLMLRDHSPQGTEIFGSGVEEQGMVVATKFDPVGHDPR